MNTMFSSFLSSPSTTVDTVENKIEEHFQGALTNDELIQFIKEQLPFSPETSLVATSLCCDEVNRPLEKSLSAVYNHYFSMGGLAGTPFGGVTAFGAMAAHIPDGGSCVVVYGPHVGVDSTGAVGTVKRRGKQHGGSCCGSAVAASSFVLSCKDNSVCHPTSIVDAQQTFVGNMLLPFAGRLAAAPDSMVELPYAMFDAQTQLMNRILKQGASNVSTSIAVLGGIQINTPGDMMDYFLPLRFDLYDKDANITEAIMQSVPRAPVSTINAVFSGALPNAAFVNMITNKLQSYSWFSPSSALLCTSLCCDEVNRPLEIALQTAFGDHFNIGGLAGFAFGGATGFGAMAAHIPDKGCCVVVYGPHVGVDSTGKVGTVERRGRVRGGSCCGSGVAAYHYVTTTTHTTAPALPQDPLDAQQSYVGSMLLPFADRLKQAKEPMADLPQALFEAQDELMQKIVSMNSVNANVVLIGGIQLNTPDPVSDYFVPRRFQVLAGKTGKVMADLM